MYKTFLKFKSRLSNRRGKLVRFMVVHVEYDRSNGGMHTKEQVICRFMQSPKGANFSVGDQAPAGAGAVSHSRNVYCLYVAMRCCNRLDAVQLEHKAMDVHMRLHGGDAHDLKSLVEEILEHKQWASSYECRYRDFASCVEQRCCKYSSCKYKHK